MAQATRGKGRIGVLVPFTNVNLEPDMMMLCPAGVSLHFHRLGGYDIDEIPDEHQMAGLGSTEISEEIRLLAGAKPDVILYGCTSATLSHGLSFDADLTERIRAMSGARTVTAAGALVNALKTLGVSRIGFASPYVGTVNDLAVDFLNDAGFATVSRADIGRDLGNYGQGELTPAEVFDLACQADCAEADAIVLSCTDMRSVEVIDALEDKLGKPVVTSNQAMMFQAISALGLQPSGQSFRAFNEFRKITNV